ncbi:MAG TPA: protoporphyrinogen oxidase [Gemmatimonadota bacterium]|nr:protoporphyrinogen oxidase [Gemmatimonadota bacterium]
MIAVVGAGITGLALGLELDRRGGEFVVFEATDRPGGVIRSAEVDGRVLDWGPQRLRLTRKMERLLDDLGLADDLVVAPPGLPLWIYRGERLREVPMSVGRFLASDIVGVGAKCRLLLEPFTRPADPAERVSTYFRRKVGNELYEALIAPLYGGLYASDPEDMQMDLSLMHVLREFGMRRSLLRPLLRRGGRIDPPPACTLRDGMEALPGALATALGDRLRLESPVLDISRSGDGWQVRTDGGNLCAEAVVLTTPAPVTGRLLRTTAPDVGDAIARLRYNPLGVVHLDAETELRGLGFQVAFSETERVLRGVTFNDSMFGRTNLYTAYLGGARNPEVVELDDAGLAALAVSEFRHCTGYDASPLAVERERIPAWDISWNAIRDLELPTGLHIAANWWSRPGLPGRFAEATRVARDLMGR